MPKMYFFPSNVSYPESISVESNAIMPGTQAKHTGVIIDFSIAIFISLQIPIG